MRSQLCVRPSSLQGNITIPPSKSHSHRAIIFGAMASGKSVIHNLLRSPDTLGMINAWRRLGAHIDDSQELITIEGMTGTIGGVNETIDVGNSGIALRFLSTLVALSPHPFTITGDHSIQYQRPMQPLLDAFRQLGVTAISTKGDGFAPLKIQGPFCGGNLTIDGRDSQHVSALLIAAMFAKKPTTIHVTNPAELPWVDLTLHWLKKLGATYTRKGYEYYRVEGGHQYGGFSYTVPGDHSSAAFPIAAALITGSELTIENFDRNDPQGDKKIVPILQEMGARISIHGNTLQVPSGGQLKGITININDCIDAVPILATVACFAKGTTKITNAHVAREKECDRLACIAHELNRMGGHVIPTDDGLIIEGKPLVGSTLHSHCDHRIAMSLAVAGLGATGETTITDVACVAKTYPTFVEDMINIGAQIE